MSEALERWLAELGLERYVEVFRENDVDLQALPHLTETDLRELGVSLGHRRILLAAISGLQEVLSAKSPTAVTAQDERAVAGTADAAPKVTADADRRLLTVFF